MTTCTRCQSSGFLNIEQVPEDLCDRGTEAIEDWLERTRHLSNVMDECQPCECRICKDDRKEPVPDDELHHDVEVCDCCGDGESWHGEPGEHYGPDDPPGNDGPYGYNGGLCECH